MQRITGYRTTDGQFFEKKKQADAHESKLTAVDELNKIAGNIPHNDDVNGRVLFHDEFAEFVMGRREMLLNILKKIKE
ncbi:hypothetical protein [Methyloversatilis sp.]|uniref:hypothetical protein n=1 Tax=Methyloversatilis sp. TaxID=2569862 RepID=UPI0035B2B9D5